MQTGNESDSHTHMCVNLYKFNWNRKLGDSHTFNDTVVSICLTGIYDGQRLYSCCTSHKADRKSSIILELESTQITEGYF